MTLYDWGKDLEEKHYRPQIEADKRERSRESNDRGEDRDQGGDRDRGNGRDSANGRDDRSSGRGYTRGGSSQRRFSPRMRP